MDHISFLSIQGQSFVPLGKYPSLSPCFLPLLLHILSPVFVSYSLPAHCPSGAKKAPCAENLVLDVFRRHWLVGSFRQKGNFFLLLLSVCFSLVWFFETDFSVVVEPVLELAL